jgi:hypothetical protein
MLASAFNAGYIVGVLLVLLLVVGLPIWAIRRSRRTSSTSAHR